MFRPDPQLQEIAEAYALDCVDFARQQFATVLDFSDDSVAAIERMLTRFHDELARARPSQETVARFAKMFGSYVGEVFRRNHGGDWGAIDVDGQTVPGIRGDGDLQFWPWVRVRNRLLNGPEDNVWHYYQALLR